MHISQYVDLEYEGGGIGEYQYYDRDSQAWNDTACYYADGGSGSNDGNNDDDGNNNDDDNGSKSRCAKMDCHLENTHFSVLGFFKHKNYDDWMEQLFKHEGMCVWTEEEYAFMKNARKVWPQGCIESGMTITEDEAEDEAGSSSSSSLYYNVKPMRNGRIAFGLYTDSMCVDDYPVTTDELEARIGNFFTDDGNSGSQDENYDFSDDTLAESMDRWNSAWDVWHMCHPCVAYDLDNTDGSKYLYNNDDYYGGNYGNYNRERRNLGGEYSAQGDVFECYDDAGYTNVNQCMKFSAKTTMHTATFRDLSLGRNQATLVKYPLSGFFDEQDRYTRDVVGNFVTYFFFASVVFGFLYSVYYLYKVADHIARETRRGKRNSKSKLSSPAGSPKKANAKSTKSKKKRRGSTIVNNDDKQETLLAHNDEEN